VALRRLPIFPSVIGQVLIPPLTGSGGLTAVHHKRDQSDGWFVVKSEWPTLLVALGCYLSYLGFTYFSGSLGLFLIPLLALTMTLHSSLQHEVLHGHPFRSQTLSEALVFPAIGLFIPYERFRDTHLRHHHDPNLTDPYDDPESNYLDPAIWGALPSWVKSVLRFNNTLFGRMLVGPLIGTVAFWKSDIDEMRGGDRTVIRAYLMHGLGVLLVLGWLWMVWEVSLWKTEGFWRSSFSTIISMQPIMRTPSFAGISCRISMRSGKPLFWIGTDTIVMARIGRSFGNTCLHQKMRFPTL